jgi:hypothetical protein
MFNVKRRRYYDYLISFTFCAEGYLTPSTGTTCVSRLNKINNFDEAESVRKFLETRIDGAKNLAINNIMYLGRNKHKV